MDTERALPSSADYEARKRRRLQQVSVALLWLITGLVYANSFRAGFPRDNRTLILEDRRIQSVTPANVRLILTQNYWYPMVVSGLYRPVTTLSFLFNYAVLGNRARPAGYHVINLLLHLLNVSLVYILACHLFGELALGFATAGIWAVHPVLTESVTNIVGRSDLLAGAAILAGLILHIKGRAALDSFGKLQYTAALLAVTATGLFAKENVLVLPALMAVYDLTFPLPGRRRFHPAHYLAIVSLLAFWWWVRSRILLSYPHPFLDNPLVGAAFWPAKLTGIKIAGRYLWLLAFPLRLSSDYSYNQIHLFRGQFSTWDDWQTAVAALACVVLILGAALSWRRHKAVFYFIAFAFLTFLPTSNLLVNIGSIMAERFLYLPAIGFAAFATVGLRAACRRLRVPTLAPTLIVLMCLACGGRTFARNYDWYDEETMARRDTAVCGNSFKTHMALAIALTANRSAPPDEAVAEIEKSLSILNGLPDSLDLPSPYNKAGQIFRERGEQIAKQSPADSGEWFRKSLTALSRAVAVDQATNRRFRTWQMQHGFGPSQLQTVGIPDVYLQYGLTRMSLHQPRLAIEALRYGQKLAPTSPEFYGVMANAYGELHETENQIIVLLEGLTLLPGERRLSALLPALYRGIDTAGCHPLTVEPRTGRVNLNLNCRPVRQHVCAARANVVKVLIEDQLRADAEPIRQESVQEMHCPAGQFDFIFPPGQLE